jgi:hypothetical protein
MSTRHLPYPADFDVNYHADRQQQRVSAALKRLNVGDVIATVEDELAQVADPHQHPLFPVVNWLLDRQLSVDGGAFWDAWRTLCQQAVDRCVAEALAQED